MRDEIIVRVSVRKEEILGFPGNLRTHIGGDASCASMNVSIWQLEKDIGLVSVNLIHALGPAKGT